MVPGPRRPVRRTRSGYRGRVNPTGRQWLKGLGVAGLVGVAATGALIARDERNRRAYSPDEVRERLHQRYARSTADRSAGGPPPAR